MMSTVLLEDVASGSGVQQSVQSLTTQRESRLSFRRSTNAPQRISLTEFAEEFECAINEKHELASRLSTALEELAAVTRLSEQSRAEFDFERRRMRSEIENLREQLSKSAETNRNSSSHGAGLKSVLAARERVIRDEFERKFQELTVEVRQERNKYVQAVEKMKSQLTGCICRG
jgi:hypothetical protein